MKQSNDLSGAARIVLIVIGITMVGSMMAGFYLRIQGQSSEDFMDIVRDGMLGLLAMLAAVRRTEPSSEPQDVKVVNTEGNPAKVEVQS